MVYQSDSTINLRIKIQGFEFFSEQFIIKQYREVEVSLRNVRLRYLGDHTVGYILTNRIGKEVISQNNFPSDVYFVSPDTLFFEFEKQTSKKTPVRIDTDAIRLEVNGKDTIIQSSDSIAKKNNTNKHINKKK
jgi:hypothetical protein